MKQINLFTKSILNVPLWEIDLLCKHHDARLDIENEEIVFCEITV